MRVSLLLVASVITFHGYSGAAQTANCQSPRPPAVVNSASADMNHGDCDGPAALVPQKVAENIVVHYGLNDSHSRSWVQEDGNGIIGISYFQRYEGNYTDGTLFYKTIDPDGSVDIDSVTSGARLEKSVLLYDSSSHPHIFVARSDDFDQVIDHYYRNPENLWESQTITHFYNEGGRFIYELSADTGPDHSFHLLILKTRSNIDSDDFMDAWLNSYLYHMTNASGSWSRELVRNYNMAFTYDMYIKSSCRQDIKVGDDGSVHVVFSEQINGGVYPSRLLYATNRTGTWLTETALDYDHGTTDDAGWFPSLCLDNSGTPHVSCMYVDRVPTYSATYCKLLFLERLDSGNWRSEIVAEHDDGYYGGDGRNYTGGLTHLIFDRNNIPHIVFSDIASTHWPGSQRLNVGNIRYAVLENGTWNLTTIYRQPLPTGFLAATEMYGMCLRISEITGKTYVVGVELVVTGEYQYTCKLLEFSWDGSPTDAEESPGNSLPRQYRLFQNHPNPFNPATAIEFDLPRRSCVTLSVYNVIGQQISVLVDDELPAGIHSVSWEGTDHRGRTVPTGVYFYRLQSGDFAETKKMLLLR